MSGRIRKRNEWEQTIKDEPFAQLQHDSQQLQQQQQQQEAEESWLLSQGVEVVGRKKYTRTKPREKWTNEEHQRFMEALRLYGREWRKVALYVKTKVDYQVRSHAQKVFIKMQQNGTGHLIPPVLPRSHNGGGGGSNAGTRQKNRRNAPPPPPPRVVQGMFEELTAAAAPLSTRPMAPWEGKDTVPQQQQQRPTRPAPVLVEPQQAVDNGTCHTMTSSTPSAASNPTTYSYQCDPSATTSGTATARMGDLRTYTAEQHAWALAANARAHEELLYGDENFLSDDHRHDATLQGPTKNVYSHHHHHGQGGQDPANVAWHRRQDAMGDGGRRDRRSLDGLLRPPPALARVQSGGCRDGDMDTSAVMTAEDTEQELASEADRIAISRARSVSPLQFLRVNSDEVRLARSQHRRRPSTSNGHNRSSNMETTVHEREHVPVMYNSIMSLAAPPADSGVTGPENSSSLSPDTSLPLLTPLGLPRDWAYFEADEPQQHPQSQQQPSEATAVVGHHQQQ